MLLLIFFPNTFKDLRPSGFPVNSAMLMDLNHFLGPYTLASFLKNLTAFCCLLSSLAGCKGITLFPNRKIVFEILFFNYHFTAFSPSIQRTFRLSATPFFL
jgi:hypothetical protein